MLIEATTQESTYHTPFPPPEFLAQLQHIDPTYPERLIQMAESTVAHRQRMATRRQEAELSAIARGQWFTLLLGAGALGLAAYMFHQGQANAAAITAMAAIVTPTLAALWTHHRNKSPSDE